MTQTLSDFFVVPWDVNHVLAGASSRCLWTQCLQPTTEQVASISPVSLNKWRCLSGETYHKMYLCKWPQQILNHPCLLVNSELNAIHKSFYFLVKSFSLYLFVFQVHLTQLTTLIQLISPFKLNLWKKTLYFTCHILQMLCIVTYPG